MANLSNKRAWGVKGNADLYSEVRLEGGEAKGEVKARILILVTWAVLSAAFSAEGGSSVDFLSANDPRMVLRFRLFLDTELTGQETFTRFEQNLEAGDIDSYSIEDATANVQESDEIKYRLPKTLIAECIDDEVRGIMISRKYSLALALKADEDNQRLTILSYHDGKLEETDLNIIQTRVKHLASSLCQDMDQSIQQLDILTSFDRQQLRTWNESMPPPTHDLMHELIEHQSKLTALNEAICAWDGSFTYQEMDRSANYLAKNLIQRGVTLGSWVPLLIGKSKWHVISMLAVSDLINLC